jgi:uncharacterized protein
MPRERGKIRAMLLQFTVGNFLSFRDPVTFSMMAAPEMGSIPADLRPISDGKNVLSISAIYGANASGKSNLIKAIAFARKMIVKGVPVDSLIEREPFLLDGKTLASNSIFQFVYEYNGLLYRYGFECNDDIIVKEWMFDVVGEERIFERITNKESKKVEIDFGVLILNEDKEFYNFVAEGTRPETLYLNELRSKNSPIAANFRDWFGKELYIISSDDLLPMYGVEWYPIQSLAAFMINVLRCIDSGISEIGFVSDKSKKNNMPTSRKNIILKGLRNLKEKGYEPLASDLVEGRECVFYTLEDDELVYTELVMFHKALDELVPFNKSMESEGTQRLIDILPFFMPMTNRTILIDELDRRLHPNLSHLLIEIWRKMNRQKSQLIFTTHDDNLLSDDLLRRDEVWLVDKDETGHSSLTSLAEFKIPDGTNIERQYLRGRFGGVPYLRREELNTFLEEIQNEGANLK